MEEGFHIGTSAKTIYKLSLPLLRKKIKYGYCTTYGNQSKIMMGKPVIKGTRIIVESLLEKLSAGETEGDIKSINCS